MIGPNHEYLQAFNQRLILSKLWKYGPLSRTELARATNLAVPTIYRVAGELTRQGLIIEGRQRRGGLGKPPLELNVNPKGAFAIGFNFDRDLLMAVLVDLQGNILQRLRFEVEQPGPKATFALMQRAAQILLAHPELVAERFLGIGVGIPGPLHLNPVPSSDLFDLPGWEGIDVAAELSKRLGHKVLLENNPIAAAIGEMWYGEGRRLENFYFVFFGLYLGGCAVLAREPNRGFGGFGGEFGSIPYSRDQRFPDNVDRLGHRVSLAGLYTALKGAGIAARQADELESLYRLRDPVLLSWLDDAVNYLAPELLRIEYLLDPEAIVFGERLPAALFNHLIMQLDVRLTELRVSYKPYGPKLLRGWAGIDAAAVGAAALPIYQAFEPNSNLVLSQPSVAPEQPGGTKPAKGVPV